MEGPRRRGACLRGHGRLERLLPVVVLLALAGVACGGASGGDEVASATGSEGSSKTATKKKDPQQAALDFARCMREHGVDVPDPQPGEGGMIKIGPGPAEAGAAVERPFDPAFEEADKT